MAYPEADEQIDSGSYVDAIDAQAAAERVPLRPEPPSSFQRDALILMTTKWLAAEAELSAIKQAAPSGQSHLTAVYVSAGTALGFIIGAVLGILVSR